MKLKDHLTKEQKRKLKESVGLSEKELKALMGMNKRGLKRKKGGAWG